GGRRLWSAWWGEEGEGERVIDEAVKRGAALSFAEHESDEEDQRPLIRVENGLYALQTIAREYLHIVGPKVMAVTGSNGKTTTKDMDECVLAPHYRVQKTIGNYNNEIGLPLTILRLE